METERRLKALEADLHVAEVAKKERTLAMRYHKVKFFGVQYSFQFMIPVFEFSTERQKVTRKIKQVQDRLKVEQKKSKKKKLTSELQELRMDLNYIFVSLREKWISNFLLFRFKHYPKLKKYISLFPPEVRNGDAVSQSKAQNTNAEREEIRIWIRDRMENGELPSEPELTLSSHRVNELTQPASWPRDEGTKSFEQKGTAESGIEEDEFFGEDEAEDRDS